MQFIHVKRRSSASAAIALSMLAGLAFSAPISSVPSTPNDASPPLAKSTAVAPAQPATQPLADDYKIGPQDLLEIQIYGIDSLKRETRVNWSGVISLPLIGMVKVAGLTGEEAEALIAAKYEKDYLRDPQVSLFIKEFTSQRITIEGAVNHPGIFPMKGQTSLLQAIAIAGGQGPLSEMNEVMLFRVENGVKKTITYDIVKIRAGEIPDPLLVSDDVVVVKRNPSRVAIRDSLFGDIINVINPLNYLRPY